MISPLEPAPPRAIGGLRDVVDDYGAYVIDQWGVIHDGHTVYPGAAEAMRHLRASGGSVVILTNSSKSDERNRDRLLDRFGIGPDHFDALVSSAQVMLDALIASGEELGGRRRPFVVADEGDEVLFDGSGLEVSELADADFVALMSVVPGDGVAEHRGWMRAAIDRELPLVCPSADVHSVSRSRGLVSGLGALVDHYRASGGVATNFGKPEVAVFDRCVEIAGVDPVRTLGIGDQVASDVVGAARSGIGSCLVLTGAGDRFAGDGLEGAAALLAIEPEERRPDLVLSTLCW